MVYDHLIVDMLNVNLNGVMVYTWLGCIQLLCSDDEL
jgi:hypothetical protein